LRIVFAGSSGFGLPALQVLAQSGHALIAVYTQPDRPAGRGLKLAASPIKTAALSLNLKVHQPVTLKPQEEQERLAQLNPDLLVVVAYGLILPPTVLRIPRLGCLNVHASLLPRWRGAAPIQRAVMAGDEESGISLMKMDAGLDTGPVYRRASLPIAPGETAGELHDRLAALGAATLRATLPDIAGGKLPPEPQTESDAPYAAKITKEEAMIDWMQGAAVLERKVRGLNPWPIAQTSWKNKPLRIWKAAALNGFTDKDPGHVLNAGAEGIDVATGDGILRLLIVQRAGGRALSAAEFQRGASLRGERLGASPNNT